MALMSLDYVAIDDPPIEPWTMTKHLLPQSICEENMITFKFSQIVTSKDDEVIPKPFLL